MSALAQHSLNSPPLLNSIYQLPSLEVVFPIVSLPGCTGYRYSRECRAGNVLVTTVVNVILMARLYAMYQSRKGKHDDVHI